MKLSFWYLSPHEGEGEFGVSIMSEVAGVGRRKPVSEKGRQVVASLRGLKMAA